MKRTISFVLAIVCAMLLCLTIPSGVGFAQYNDAKYDSYKNMGASNEDSHSKYVVPNLYRQDASYTNVKTFPLVVSGSVEYFPLDIFALYSYLEVVYGKLSYGFYINNTKNNHYVAFDLETGTTTTHDGGTLDIQAKLFYRTYYVPAKAVCDVLGMKFETYDSPEDGIRAARISDERAKNTLNELVAMYSPPKKEPDDNTQTEPDLGNPSTEDGTNEPDDGQQGSVTGDNQNQGTTETPDPVQPDPYRSIASRTIYLTFENCPNAYTDGVLNVLAEYGEKALFFVSAENILEYPDTVRRILTDGHSIGIYVPDTETPVNAENAGQIIQLIDSANEALSLVTKTKTRFVRLAYGLSAKLDGTGFAELVRENGYELYDWTTDAGDYSGRAQNAYNSIISSMSEYPNVYRTVFLRFGSYAATSATLERLFEFCDKYTQFTIVPTDYFTQAPVFVND